MWVIMLVEDGANFLGVAAGGAAGFRSDAQIAGIHKFDVFGGFFQPFRVSAFGQGGTVFEAGIARLDVGFFFGGVVLGGIWRRARGDGDGRIAAVAIGAAEKDGFCRVHRGLIGRGMAGDAA